MHPVRAAPTIPALSSPCAECHCMPNHVVSLAYLRYHSYDNVYTPVGNAVHEGFVTGNKVSKCISYVESSTNGYHHALARVIKNHKMTCEKESVLHVSTNLKL